MPVDYQEYHAKEFIQVPLKTDSRSLAETRSSNLNQLLEAYWQGLSFENDLSNSKDFSEIVKRTRMSGFQFRTMEDLTSSATPSELINRVNVADMAASEKDAAAILGNVDKQSPTIDGALKLYFEHEHGNLVGRSDDQLRKWKNPRIRAAKNFKSVIGNISLENIKREDVLRYRNWWVSRIQSGDRLSPNSANKEFGFVRQILRAAADNGGVDINVDLLFKKINLKDENQRSRHPFETSYIKDVLLNRDLLKMNDECQLFIYAMADTGARVAELVGLEESDILLHDDVPHIKIRKNALRSLKTPQSERDIPLVGSSLVAFRELPGGFVRYRGKSDLISATINKYLRENGFIPSDRHSLYSLRHSFEDRLTAAEPPDKVQAALMGHKYVRPKYGHGPSLEQKQLWLQKIALIP
ncbi:MAG: phage integrase SAM-like domain-containing protein [Candidatus Thiodiazotropha lotti]|nr:phage integrase SAM-like domain-containing protein [Candidatus Thiodiazotropha lotti]